MKKQIIILILLATLFIGCDDLEQTVDYQLPYVEKLVIQGQFGINSNNFSVTVTKSLPPLEKVTLEKVTIKDAECKVYYRDTVIELNNTSFSTYYSDTGINIEEGVEYRLEVKWKDKIAIAKSTIPKLPIIKSVRAVKSNGDFSNYTTYWISIQSVDKGMVSINSAEDNFDNNDGLKLINNVGRIDTIGYTDYNSTDGQELPSTFFMKFYDIAYYPYYVTRYEGQSESGIFSGGGLNVEGNVEGDNTIGVWVGVNTLIDKIDNYIVK